MSNDTNDPLGDGIHNGGNGKAKPVTAPVCPHCLQDPATISTLGPILLGTMQSMVIFCGNLECRKIWAVQILTVQQPQIAKPVIDFSKIRSIS